MTSPGERNYTTPAWVRRPERAPPPAQPAAARLTRCSRDYRRLRASLTQDVRQCHNSRARSSSRAARLGGVAFAQQLNTHGQGRDQSRGHDRYQAALQRLEERRGVANISTRADDVNSKFQPPAMVQAESAGAKSNRAPGSATTRTQDAAVERRSMSAQSSRRSTSRRRDRQALNGQSGAVTADGRRRHDGDSKGDQVSAMCAGWSIRRERRGRQLAEHDRSFRTGDAIDMDGRPGPRDGERITRTA